MAIFRYALVFSLAIACGTSRAQNCYPASDGSVYGVPVCTGFHVYSNLEDQPVMNFKEGSDNKELRKTLKRIERQADSLKKEAAKLRDSLMHQSWDMKNLFGNMSDNDLFSIPLPDMKELELNRDSLKLRTPRLQIPSKPFFDYFYFNDPKTPQEYFDPSPDPFYAPYSPEDRRFYDKEMIRPVPTPKKKERSTPIPNFPDWKMQQLNSKDIGLRL